MIAQWVLAFGSLLVCGCNGVLHWLFPDPTPEQHRRRRRRKRLQVAVARRYTPPSSRRFIQTMAASAVGAQLMAQRACGLQVGDPFVALKHVDRKSVV